MQTVSHRKMDRKETLGKWLQERPDDVFLHYAWSLELISEGNLHAAAEKLEWIRNHFPDYLPLYYTLAGIYAQSGLTRPAVEMYEAGIELARQKGERKTEAELRSALEELTL